MLTKFWQSGKLFNNLNQIILHFSWIFKNNNYAKTNKNLNKYTTIHNINNKSLTIIL